MHVGRLRRGRLAMLDLVRAALLVAAVLWVLGRCSDAAEADRRSPYVWRHTRYGWKQVKIERHRVTGAQVRAERRPDR